MATKKTNATITLTPEELKALIQSAVQEAVTAAKPQRSKSDKSEAAKKAKKAAKDEEVRGAAEGLGLLAAEVSFLPKRQKFHPQRVWSKGDPGPGLLSKFSPKDGTPQTWLVEKWTAAKSGNGFVAVARFVPPAEAPESPAESPAEDMEDFLKSVG